MINISTSLTCSKCRVDRPTRSLVTVKQAGTQTIPTHPKLFRQPEIITSETLPPLEKESGFYSKRNLGLVQQLERTHPDWELAPNVNLSASKLAIKVFPVLSGQTPHNYDPDYQK